MTDRCQPNDLAMADAMPFQQHHECRTTLPIEKALTNQYFMNVRSNLKIGDQVVVCQYDRKDVSHQQAKLLAVATVRIKNIDAHEVGLTIIGQISRIKHKAPKVEGEDAPVERYAEADWTFTHKGHDKWAVLDGKEKELAAGLSREAAVMIVGGHEPLPA